MRLFRLVVHGLLGRKRDTAILSVILFLAFLFLSLSPVLLSSFARTAQQAREELHGGWQLLYSNASPEAAAACAAAADAAEIRVLGSTKEGNLIGTADQAVLDLGCLKLTEGRLPQGEDEIVLVRGRTAKEPALGEEFDAVYLYTYMQGGHRGLSDFENQKQAVLDSLRVGETDPERLQNRQTWQANYALTLACLERRYGPEAAEALTEGQANPYDGLSRTWDELHEAFLTYVTENYDPEENVVRFQADYAALYGYDKPYYSNYDYALPPEYDLESFLAEYEDELLYEWATEILHPFQYNNYAYGFRTVRAYPGGLFSYEGFLINVKNEGVQTLYSGWAFSEEVRARSSIELQTAQALLYKTYTVVGYIEPYADHWDVRGLTMPDAFVSDAAADAQLRALRRAEEEYYEGAPSFEPTEILLLRNPDLGWRETAEAILPIFSALQEPWFQLEGVSPDMSETEIGVIIGLDPGTGEEKVCELRKYSSTGYYLTDSLTGVTYSISGDPRSSVRWDEFSEILLPLQPEALTLTELEANNNHPLRLNQYAYPPNGIEDQLQTLCRGLLIGVAACSVFQVFWVQLRRRRRRLTTLMAMGATDRQVLTMLLLEIGLLLAVNGALGLLAGFGLARLLTSRMETLYTVLWPQIWGGVGLCAAAVAVSAGIPMLLVLGTPLTGRDRVNRRALKLAVPKRERRQTYARQILRQLRVNRARTALQVAMTFLLAASCLITVFLSCTAFSDYRRQVEETAMPDYEILVPYGMSGRFWKDTIAEHPALTEHADLSITREAPNVTLHVDEALAESPIVRALRGIPDATLPGGELAVRVVGLEPEALAAFLDAFPALTVDREALEKGAACVLLVPRFLEQDGAPVLREAEETELSGLRTDERAGALLSLHYAPSYEAVSLADESVRAGDRLHLTAYTQQISGERLNASSRDLELPVEAVLSTLDPPIWPLSAREPAFVVVTGLPAISTLYPSASTRMTADQTRYHSRMAPIFYPDCYGLTRILLTNHPDADPTAMDTAAYDLAEALGVDLTNYRLSKEQLYSAAENRCLLFLLLGVEIALVISTLLFSESEMALEQDRFRYGLLQALGLSDARVFLGQLWQSFLTALLGLLGANLALGLVLLLAALFTASPRLTLSEILGPYPWAVHGLVCGAELVLCTLLQTLPIRRLSRVQPIENIRS